MFGRFELLVPFLLLVPSAFAGRIKYEVRIIQPDRSYTSRSTTLNMPDQHLNLITNNIYTWSDGRFRASRPSAKPDLVVVSNTNALEGVNDAAVTSLQQEMAMVIMCNIPGGSGGAASVAGFDRRRDCKKRSRGHRLEA